MGDIRLRRSQDELRSSKNVRSGKNSMLSGLSALFLMRRSEFDRRTRLCGSTLGSRGSRRLLNYGDGIIATGLLWLTLGVYNFPKNSNNT